jgi:hypothetical protein
MHASRDAVPTSSSTMRTRTLTLTHRWFRVAWRWSRTANAPELRPNASPAMFTWTSCRAARTRACSRARVPARRPLAPGVATRSACLQASRPLVHRVTRPAVPVAHARTPRATTPARTAVSACVSPTAPGAPVSPKAAASTITGSVAGAGAGGGATRARATTTPAIRVRATLTARAAADRSQAA